MRYRGLGWERAHHPWSKGGDTFSPQTLFEHLINTVIPLEEEEEIPDEAPVELPSPPDMIEIGTTAEIDLGAGTKYAEQVANLKRDGYKEKEEREARGEGDKYADQQTVNMPIIGGSFKGFRIEMLFEYNDDSGSSPTNWYHGKDEKILNVKTNTVQIKWDEDCLADGDKKVTREKLLVSKWNPDKPTKGAWRKYIK